uniref:LAGLIDADG endonuclease n=1 Tax=Spizellomyces sp. 'palustris' TaxID=117820 RepID=UPI0010FC1ECA|nr:LAGLIDADG endonuclease [Spizellomyces sp. 'palustris']QCQ69041.1 LAGLIDADG endonuclease [Spizellomyces sp. 'palustris']
MAPIKLPIRMRVNFLLIFHYISRRLANLSLFDLSLYIFGPLIYICFVLHGWFEYQLLTGFQDVFFAFNSTLVSLKSNSNFSIPSHFLCNPPHTKFSSIDRRSKKLTQDQKEILVGLCLGDLYISRANLSSNAHLSFEYGVYNGLFYTYHLLEEVFHTFVMPGWCDPKLRYRGDPSINKGPRWSAYFWTRSYACFNPYWDMFYAPNTKGGRAKFMKVVPNNIGDMLTAKSLAYWAMDDGFASQSAFGFSTNGFFLHEVELLSSVLLINFGIITTLNPTYSGYILLLSSQSLPLFVSLVEPYFLPSMSYEI